MRSEGMLLFVNVALGLCLGAGVVTLATQLANTDVLFSIYSIAQPAVGFLVSLFIIYFTNLLRAFLGFVKFYQDESLYDEDYEKLVDENKLHIIRLFDFLAMMSIVLALAFQGLALHHNKAFVWIFIISSILFVGRNLLLTISFRVLESKSSQLEKESDKEEIERRTGVVNRWLVYDILFLVFGFMLLLGIEPPGLGLEPSGVQLAVFGSAATMLMVVSWMDMWSNRAYYFGRTLIAND